DAARPVARRAEVDRLLLGRFLYLRRGVLSAYRGNRACQEDHGERHVFANHRTVSKLVTNATCRGLATGAGFMIVQNATHTLRNAVLLSRALRPLPSKLVDAPLNLLYAMYWNIKRMF